MNVHGVEQPSERRGRPKGDNGSQKGPCERERVANVLDEQDQEPAILSEPQPRPPSDVRQKEAAVADGLVYNAEQSGQAKRNYGSVWD